MNDLDVKEIREKSGLKSNKVELDREQQKKPPFLEANTENLLQRTKIAIKTELESKYLLKH